MDALDLFNEVFLRVSFVDIHGRIAEGAAFAITHRVGNDQPTVLSKYAPFIFHEGM